MTRRTVRPGQKDVVENKALAVWPQCPHIPQGVPGTLQEGIGGVVSDGVLQCPAGRAQASLRQGVLTEQQLGAVRSQPRRVPGTEQARGGEQVCSSTAGRAWQLQAVSTGTDRPGRPDLRVRDGVLRASGGGVGVCAGWSGCLGAGEMEFPGGATAAWGAGPGANRACSRPSAPRPGGRLDRQAGAT